MFKYNLIKKFISFFFVVSTSLSINFVQAQIITSLKPLGFITAAIANGVTKTDILLPDGASPHTYSLKPSDLIKLKVFRLCSLSVVQLICCPIRKLANCLYSLVSK